MEKNATIEMLVLVFVVFIATMLMIMANSQHDRLERIERKIDLMACHTDSECYNACRDLGGSHDACEEKFN